MPDEASVRGGTNTAAARTPSASRTSAPRASCGASPPSAIWVTCAERATSTTRPAQVNWWRGTTSVRWDGSHPAARSSSTTAGPALTTMKKRPSAAVRVTPWPGRPTTRTSTPPSPKPSASSTKPVTTAASDGTRSSAPVWRAAPPTHAAADGSTRKRTESKNDEGPSGSSGGAPHSGSSQSTSPSPSSSTPLPHASGERGPESARGGRLASGLGSPPQSQPPRARAPAVSRRHVRSTILLPPSRPACTLHHLDVAARRRASRDPPPSRGSLAVRPTDGLLMRW